MNPKLKAAARILELPTRKLDAVVVPLANGGRGVETSEQASFALLAVRMSDMRRAIDSAEEALQ